MHKYRTPAVYACDEFVRMRVGVSSAGSRYVGAGTVLSTGHTTYRLEGNYAYTENPEAGA